MIRVGVNSGSLGARPAGVRGARPGGRLVESAVRNCALVEELGFAQIKVSVKSSSPQVTIAANRDLAKRVPYPLHIWASPRPVRAGRARIRSAVALGVLLAEGIGDTIRVSLTGDPVEEVRVALEILRALELAPRGPRVISCPTCGRTEIDLEPLALEVERRLDEIGPGSGGRRHGLRGQRAGEARKADFGIAGGEGEGVVFAKGRPVQEGAGGRAGRRPVRGDRPADAVRGRRQDRWTARLSCGRGLRAARRSHTSPSRRIRCGRPRSSCPRSKKTRPTPRPSATS